MNLDHVRPANRVFFNSKPVSGLSTKYMANTVTFVHNYLPSYLVNLSVLCSHSMRQPSVIAAFEAHERASGYQEHAIYTESICESEVETM